MFFRVARLVNFIRTYYFFSVVNFLGLILYFKVAEMESYLKTVNNAVPPRDVVNSLAEKFRYPK